MRRHHDKPPEVPDLVITSPEQASTLSVSNLDPEKSAQVKSRLKERIAEIEPVKPASESK